MHNMLLKIKNLLSQAFARNALWLILGKVYQMAVNLVVSIIVARYLGPSGYGLIDYAASLCAMFTSLCTLGINSILVNELLREKEHEGEILGTSVFLRLCASTLSVLTILLLARILNPDAPETVLVVGIYSTTLILQSFELISYWYQSRLESRVSAVIAGAGYTAAAVYKIVLLIAGSSVAWFAASHVVELALVAVLLLGAYSRSREPDQPLRISLARGKVLLGRSYHFILSGLMVALYGQMDRIMLKHMLSDAAVGYYSAATHICAMWNFLLMAIIDSARPVILCEFQRNREKYEQNLVRLYQAILFISLAVAAVISLLAPWIIRILYGQAYLPATNAVRIVSWMTGFSYLGVARSIWSIPHGKQKYEKYIAASGAVCNLCLNAVMIPLWGVNGAAIATLVTQVFTNFIVGFLIPDIRQNNRLLLQALCIRRGARKGGA